MDARTKLAEIIRRRVAGTCGDSDPHVDTVALVSDILAAFPQIAGWRDISEAPKDGTEIIAFENGEPYRSAWRLEEGNEGPDREGWWDFCNQSFENPTHWMPAPPADSSEKE